MQTLGHASPHFWRSFAVSGVIACDVRLPFVHAKLNPISYARMIRVHARCANASPPSGGGGNGAGWGHPVDRAR